MSLYRNLFYLLLIITICCSSICYFFHDQWILWVFLFGQISIATLSLAAYIKTTKIIHENILFRVSDSVWLYLIILLFVMILPFSLRIIFLKYQFTYLDNIFYTLAALGFFQFMFALILFLYPFGNFACLFNFIFEILILIFYTDIMYIKIQVLLKLFILIIYTLFIVLLVYSSKDEPIKSARYNYFGFIFLTLTVIFGYHHPFFNVSTIIYNRICLPELLIFFAFIAISFYQKLFIINAKSNEVTLEIKSQQVEVE